MSMRRNLGLLRHAPPYSLPNNLRLARLAIVIRVEALALCRDSSSLFVEHRISQHLYPREPQVVHANVTKLGVTRFR